jgi:catechol 2,3-dioxygenase-like lactoylglutathione lyase family enzyme
MLEPRIALITVLTGDMPAMRAFYEDVLGFRVKTDMDQYVEFESDGVRFSVCHRAIMSAATEHADYALSPTGQRFELAFPCSGPGGVDDAYRRIVAAGAVPVKPPADMPWGQRTAFFADPEGNIHELFADLDEVGASEAQGSSQ